MNATSVRKQESIVAHILLRTDSTLQNAMVGLDLLSILFARIELLALDSDVAELASVGSRTLGDALIECREHAGAGDIIGLVDCLARTASAHRIAKDLLSIIKEISDVEIGELAQLGMTLASSILDDMGA
ncbi:hypothetical protein ACFPTO_02235 [Paraburkholderia denitrificans]|uniref:Uncharacterized protein n=1 Tax=Paraburkholderia denitrificans TaxID=694025 RepID=A0ABW0J3L5_9BURK